ncbi:MAG TPA: acyltransferase [Pseudonocardiaceae bacterium]|jgi:fucose 4-O-acetylase-like acetyltransferase
MSTVVGRTRDPFVDVLRTCAILVVACGHWIMPVLARHGATLTASNALATPGWWLLTWPLQVMPVFFFAGGAANHHSYAAGGDPRRWLAQRLGRLAVPVLPLLAVWLVLPEVLHGLGLPAQPVALASGIVGQLLWFLAVYVLTVVAVPLTHRWGLPMVAVLGVAALGVDALRFDGLPLVGYVNELLVWLAISRLGAAYASNQLRPSRAVAMGVAGFAGTALLILFGHYPDSMVGLPGQAVSNMAPATTCLLTLGIGQIGVLLALREPILRWAVRPGQARLLTAVGRRCMTVYLWHMPALVVVAGVAVLGFGYATPPPGSPMWLVVTPLWIAALTATLSVLVRIFGRFETVAPVSGAPSARRLAVAVPLLCAGCAGIAVFGFADVGVAVLWSAAVVVGLCLARPAGVTVRWLAAAMDAIFR